ncbi:MULTISPECIES: hypothetical protein [Aeromonas]|uniref:Uncharacterized protein n=2 Tax=Aeromonas TaxID=642 RepID=A0AAX3P7W6_AERHY|nr:MULTISPECIES: hypothetical protein [Aeromonas]MDX7648019.1 hypothetical protein [Aeromonas caviae]WEE27459.1 hypothetical protein PY771_03830 [Aeromonas hydrophila]
MGMAICFKCGSEKSGALLACGACGTTPRLNSELALSLVLTDHLSSKTQLAHYSHELRNHLKLSVPSDALAQAQEALKDPQLMTMLGAQPASSASAAPVPTAASSRPTAVPPVQSARNTPSPRARAQRTLKTTAFHQTPFAILGVTTRDDRRRIVELAEEKSLELDHDVCQKARSDLTNPRTRLSAEIAWLPGVSPRKASQLVEGLLHDAMAVREESGLPTLAHLNLLAAAFEAVDSEHDAEDLASFIQEVAYLVDEIDPEDVLRDINEDRAVSGFPEVRALDQIEAELAERKRYYRSAIKDALDRLPSTTLVQVMTDTVEGVALGGEDHAPELIDDLVDSYEVETQGFLLKEAENVHKLIKAARESANSGEAAVKPYVDKLDAVARNWDKVAQPIQLSAKARGIDHEASRDLAYEIRSLAIDLFNTHDMLTQSQRLIGLLQELFAELPEVSERVEQDADALAEIFHERKQAVARRDEWAREITYRAEIGVMFKDTLSISPDGISWKGQSFSLDSITRVRWGGVRHSVNGVPTGTTYTIAFGDKRSEAVVELKKEDIYSKFIDKLWRAVCVRLLGEMLEALKDGRDLYFGDALLHDDGITLVKHKFLGANERVRCTWGQVQIWNADGSFCIGSKDDKKTNVGISYIHVANTHIMEQLIRMAFKKPGLRRLSELLQ